MSEVQETTATASLFDQLGGEAAVDAAVDVFNRRALGDYRINRFFDNSDMEKLAAKQKTFLTMAFGGPNNYTGSGLRAAHAKLVKMGLNASHFDIFVGHLTDTLVELSVPPALIAQVTTIAESVRDDILGK
jgi:hemoglobin